MHKSAMKCNETLGKWCKNKHGASKIIDTLETYQHHISEDQEILEKYQEIIFYQKTEEAGRRRREEQQAHH
jgi:hypothetical protein